MRVIQVNSMFSQARTSSGSSASTAILRLIQRNRLRWIVYTFCSSKSHALLISLVPIQLTWSFWGAGWSCIETLTWKCLSWHLCSPYLPTVMMRDTRRSCGDFSQTWRAKIASPTQEKTQIQSTFWSRWQKCRMKPKSWLAYKSSRIYSAGRGDSKHSSRTREHETICSSDCQRVSHSPSSSLKWSRRQMRRVRRHRGWSTVRQTAASCGTLMMAYTGRMLRKLLTQLLPQSLFDSFSQNNLFTYFLLYYQFLQLYNIIG